MFAKSNTLFFCKGLFFISVNSLILMGGVNGHQKEVLHMGLSFGGGPEILLQFGVCLLSLSGGRGISWRKNKFSLEVILTM